MRAMTWWDHETDSVWSQPWGLAIAGALEGTRLKMIPANIVPWAAWIDDHPDTLLMDLGSGGFGNMRERFRENYVIGITLGEHAKAYPFRATSKHGIVNDWIGSFPVLVLADPDTKAVHTYLRTVGDGELEFTLQDGRLVDRGTGSVWDVARGISVDGPLRGELLQRVPYMTSFDWDWEDFFPDSEIYGDRG